jgi:putative salt-induced outer membrane protein
MRQPILAIAAIHVTLLPARAVGQADQKDPISLTADLGFVNTTGNTEVTTLSGSERLEATHGRWTFGQGLAVVYGRTSGTTTANQWRAELRADYGFTPDLGVYLLGGWERNRFAGIGRRFEEGTGLLFKLIASERDHLELEGGLSLNQQRDLAGVTANFASARAAASFKHRLTDGAFVQQTLESLTNLKDSQDERINSETTLVAPLLKRIALKASYTVRFDNQPEPTYRKTDRLFSTAVQVVF